MFFQIRLLILVYDILVFIFSQNILDCIAFKHVLVFTFIDSIKKQYFMFISFPITSPAIILIHFFIVKQVKVDVPKETIGAAIIYFAFSTLRHVTNSSLSPIFFETPIFKFGEKEYPSS